MRRLEEERDILKKPRGTLPGSASEVPLCELASHQYAITTMCQVLRVARAGFYHWLHKPVSDREQENSRLLQLIRDSYSVSRGVYGARRVFDDLREAGETGGKHRVARLIARPQDQGIAGLQGTTPDRRAALDHRTQSSQP